MLLPVLLLLASGLLYWSAPRLAARSARLQRRWTGHQHDQSCAVFKCASEGDYDGARRASQGQPSVHPALHALVAAVDGDPTAAARLWRMYEDKPGESMTASCVALWRVSRSDWAAVAAMMPEGAHLRIGAVHAGISGAYSAGEFGEAAAIGEAALRAVRHPLIAYNTACSWARAGDVQRAWEALTRAVDLGFEDWSLIEADADLDLVRARPEFPAWRAAAQNRDRAQIVG